MARRAFATLTSPPVGLAVDSGGNLCVGVDGPASSIYKYTPDGVQSTFATGLNGPIGLAFDSAGNLFATNYTSGTIYKFAPDGTRGTFASGLSGPMFLAFAPTATPTPTPTVTPTATPTPTPTIPVTVHTDVEGRSFSVDGTSYTSAQTFTWVPGSSHTITTTSPQNGATGVRYAWSSWTGGGAISHTVAPTTNKIYTANFNTQYFLAMSHGTGGTVTPASRWKNSGAAVSISATPASGYHFSNWTGTGTGLLGRDQSGFNHNERPHHRDSYFHS